MHNHRIRKLSAEALAALLVASALSGFPLAAHAATANATAPAVTETTSAPAATASTALNDSSETPTPTSTSPTDQTPPPKDPSPAPQAPTHTPAELKALTQGKSATELAAMIKTGQVNAQELVEQAFQQIKTENPALNDVIYTDPTGAAAQVKAVDPNAPFAGVPILIKGLGQAMKGYPGTNGLTFEADNKYTYTKNFVQQLQKMGFIILGETNFPELGLINVTQSDLNGNAGNPWDATRNPGGSSGGSAAAVAAGWVSLATGNDAGGSLRIPASWSGVIGLKPTQGLILGDSTTPSVVNFAETRSIADTQALLTGLMNPAHQDMLQPVPQDLTQLKIAYSTTSPVGTPVSPDAKAAVLQAVAFLRQQGFQVEEHPAPVDGVQLMQAYFLGALSNGSTANYLANHFLHRNLTADDVTNHVISPMTYALYEASKKAPQTVGAAFKGELALVKQAMTAFHQEYPLYLTPTTAVVAPLNSDPAFLPADVEKLKASGDLPFDQQMQLIYDAWLHGLTKTPFTQLANLAGEPALSLPTYLSAANLPLGIQLQGAKGSDQTLLAVGKLFEDHHQFKLLDQQVSSDAEQPVTSEEHGAEPQTPATPADQTVPDAKQAQTQTEPSQPAAEQPGTTPDEPQIATPVDQPATTGPKPSNALVSTGQASQPADHEPAIAVSEQPTPTLTDQLATAAQQPERIATKPNVTGSQTETQGETLARKPAALTTEQQPSRTLTPASAVRLPQTGNRISHLAWALGSLGLFAVLSHCWLRRQLRP